MVFSVLDGDRIQATTTNPRQSLQSITSGESAAVDGAGGLESINKLLGNKNVTNNISALAQLLPEGRRRVCLDLVKLAMSFLDHQQGASGDNLNLQALLALLSQASEGTVGMDMDQMVPFPTNKGTQISAVDSKPTKNPSFSRLPIGRPRSDHIYRNMG